MHVLLHPDGVGFEQPGDGFPQLRDLQAPTCPAPRPTTGDSHLRRSRGLVEKVSVIISAKVISAGR